MGSVPIVDMRCECVECAENKCHSRIDPEPADAPRRDYARCYDRPEPIKIDQETCLLRKQSKQPYDDAVQITQNRRRNEIQSFWRGKAVNVPPPTLMRYCLD